MVRVLRNARPTQSCMCATCLTAGVADGVGGWHAEGIDPSLFAKAMLRKCAKLFTSGRMQYPKEILKWAYEEVLWVEAKTYGESPTLQYSVPLNILPQYKPYGSIAIVRDVCHTVV